MNLHAKHIFLLGACLLATNFMDPSAVRAANSIAIAGSTALLPLVKAEAQRAAQLHPTLHISVSGGGSGTGLTEVAIGAIDIGTSDIQVRGSSELHDHRVAVVGFALIANQDVSVTSLTRRQLMAIFSGQVSNWRDVGGHDEAIVVINRPRSSGTRKVFTRVLMGATPIADSSLTVDASGTVVATVKMTPGSLSYVALSAIRQDPIHVIAIDGIRPTRDAITHGTYALWAYEHMYTSGPPRQEVEAFIAQVRDDRTLIEKLGYIPFAAMHITRSDR